MRRTLEKIICSFLGMVFLGPGSLWAEPIVYPDVPHLKDVRARAQVTEVRAGVLRYDYTVENQAGNKGDIGDLEIDISKTAGTSVPSLPHDIDHDATFVIFNAEDNVVPVKVLSPGSNPRKWSASIGWGSAGAPKGEANPGVVGWTGIGEGFGEKSTSIPPGERLAGFALLSTGLPGIREFQVVPDYTPASASVISNIPFGADVPDDQLCQAECFSFLGKTVGPVGIPDLSVPADFLKTIIGYEEEAFSMGWIDNAGINQSLNAKLENALKKLTAGETQTATNILQAFLNEVDAQAGKHLTSEAVALLKFNTAYLLTKIGGSK